MFKKKWVLVLLSSIVFSLSFISQSSIVFAEDAANGGAVQTNGVIGFYDDTQTSTSSTSPSASSDGGVVTPPSTAGPTGTTKPYGALPSTGELVKKSLFISGIAVIILVLFLYYFGKKKRKREVH